MSLFTYRCRVKPRLWWAVVDPKGKRPPCIMGKRKIDAEMMCDPDEVVVRVYVCEAKERP